MDEGGDGKEEVGTQWRRAMAWRWAHGEEVVRVGR